MTYETVQNSTQLDGWIKKSTYLPYLVRVFSLNCNQRDFKCCNPLIHYLIMLHLFVTLFGFETCNLHPLWIFWILAFVLTCESGSNKIWYRQEAFSNPYPNPQSQIFLFWTIISSQNITSNYLHSTFRKAKLKKIDWKTRCSNILFFNFLRFWQGIFYING